VVALVEGTLTCYGDMVCIQFRAISTFPEEKQLWIEDYMVDKNEILNLYSRIIQKMAHEMKINLTPQGETWLAEKRRIVPEAYDAYLQGRILLDQFNPPSFHAAVDSFKKAIALEPEWAAPYAGISEVQAYQRQMGIGSESDIIMMYEYLNKALELDPNSAEAHLANAVIAAWTEFAWKKAENEFVKAIDLNPSIERSHSFYAHLLTILRRTDEALYHGKRALELDPENPFTVGLYVQVLLGNNKCQEAINFIKEALSIDPDHLFLQGMLTDAYKCSGDYDRAFEYWKKGQYKIWEKFGVTELLEKTYHEQGWIAFIRELKRINEGVMAEFLGNRLPAVLSARHIELGEYDKYIDYLEMWYEIDPKNPSWPYLFTKGYYDKMKGYPRYLALLEKFNLPVSEE
jgi:tetratricopeptide (TPR) repeat protein